MHSLAPKVITYIFLSVCAIGIWMYAYFYYEEHKADIWSSVETIALTFTLPFKIAELYRQAPVEELPVPVYGVSLSEIADTWGAARSEGRTHEGVDIFAPEGTPVFSATPGYVLRAGENTLGGLYVMTIGPGGVRYYYAHLDSIAEDVGTGMKVTVDTVLGFVGNTGNASGTPPHLHLGMYIDGPQNPFPLLVE